MRLLAVIIAGGKSTRMGGVEKAFINLQDKPLLTHVMARLAPQVDAIILNANGAPQRFAAFSCPVLADAPCAFATPLLGLHAGLRHASHHGFERVLTASCDTPFLPADLVQRLAVHDTAIACSGQHEHYLSGLWPVSLLPLLEQTLFTDRMQRMRDWATATQAARVMWPHVPYDPFFNINTPQDVQQANTIAAEIA